MKKLCLMGAISAAALSLFAFGANAGTFNVVSGTFDVFDPGSSYVGSASLNGNGALVEGAFNGDASGMATDASATYAGFDAALFLGVPLYLYYAPSGVYDDPGASLHAAPTIDFATMTADMTSIFANWNSNQPQNPDYIGEFNVGGIASVVTIDSFSWELSWSQLQATGPFQGMTTNMTMVVSQVPLPAAVWLFSSGLLGLIGIAWKNAV